MSQSITSIPSGVQPAGQLEIEWQFAADSLDPVREWLLARPNVDGLSLEPRPTLNLHDTYWDTATWTILRAGYSLRVRCHGEVIEATLKAVNVAKKKGLAKRREIT